MALEVWIFPIFQIWRMIDRRIIWIWWHVTWRLHAIFCFAACRYLLDAIHVAIQVLRHLHLEAPNSSWCWGCLGSWARGFSALRARLQRPWCRGPMLLESRYIRGQRKAKRVHYILVTLQALFAVASAWAVHRARLGLLNQWDSCGMDATAVGSGTNAATIPKEWTAPSKKYECGRNRVSRIGSRCPTLRRCWISLCLPSVLSC